jgi:predicted SprT family Zn-dependent metalloprotease
MPHKDPVAKKAYLKSYHAKWYQANKEKRLAQIELYQTTKSDDWRKLIGQKHHLKTRYNLTPEQYNEMARQQDYKCAICNTDVTNNIRANKQIALSVDHNHTTGNIRELLCMKCNYGLGYFRDSAEILDKASKYIDKHNK